MSQKFTMRVAVNLVLIQNGEVLLSRRLNTGWKDGQYGVIAGHVDGNEQIAEAMAREAKEEADLDIAAADLRLVHVQHRISHDYEYIDFNLQTEKWTGELRNLEPDKCDDLSWHPLNNLPENTIPYIRLVFESIAKGDMFSEWREPDA